MRILTDNRKASQRGYTSREIAHALRERTALGILLVLVMGSEAWKWWRRRNHWATKLDRQTRRYAKREMKRHRSLWADR